MQKEIRSKGRRTDVQTLTWKIYSLAVLNMFKNDSLPFYTYRFITES